MSLSHSHCLVCGFFASADVSPSGVGVIPAIGRLLSVVFNVVGVVVVVVVVFVVVVVVVVVVVFEVKVDICISPVSSFSSI